jgi:GGDEF domain-containing protein
MVIVYNNTIERLKKEYNDFEEALNGCTVSIGAAKFSKDTYSIDKLIDFADKALYISKKSRNKVTIFMK